jgi:hypothetical protein
MATTTVRGSSGGHAAALTGACGSDEPEDQRLKQTPVDVKRSSTVVTPNVSGMKFAHCVRDIHGLVVIDEIQRRPDLFPVLRVLADWVEAVPLDTLAKPGRLFEEKAS